jgi:hypothetical protein
LKFLPGNPGRPKGSRNKLAGHVIEDVLKFWNQPVEGTSGRTRGQAALMMSFRTNPGEFLRFVSGLLPRELILENVMGELDDDGIDDLLVSLRRRLEEQRAQAALPVEVKALEPAKH